MNQITDRVNFEEVTGLFLKVQADLGTSQQGVAPRIFNNAERVGIRLPNVLLVIIVFGSHDNAISNCEGFKDKVLNIFQVVQES